jgi:hypothetical protein
MAHGAVSQPAQHAARGDRSVLDFDFYDRIEPDRLRHLDWMIERRCRTDIGGARNSRSSRICFSVNPVCAFPVSSSFPFFQRPI